MSRWYKAFLIALPLALLFTIGSRFIQHTDRQYSYWINLYGESVAWVEARCAELSTPGACAGAHERRSFLASLRAYRDRVNAWWRPALAMAAIAWMSALASLAVLAWQRLRRPH